MTVLFINHLVRLEDQCVEKAVIQVDIIWVRLRRCGCVGGFGKSRSDVDKVMWVFCMCFNNVEHAKHFYDIEAHACVDKYAYV